MAKKVVPGVRRRVEDEGDEDYDLEDDSLTEGSLGSDDGLADDSDTSNIDEASPASTTVKKLNARAANGDSNGKARGGVASKTSGRPGKGKNNQSTVSDTDVMLNGLSISDQPEPVKEMNFDDLNEPQSPSKVAAPIVVSSSSAVMDNPHDRRRREHDEYRRKRDEDPSFVPNRGAFFMHDHRHSGPSANGFRPFGRGGRGRGRGGIGGPFAPYNQQQLHNPADPTISAPWTHDMHDAIAEPSPVRPARPSRYASQEGHFFVDDGPPNGDGYIPTCPPNPTPINRTLSTEKHIGNVQVRVWIPSLFKEPIVFPAIPVKQYTKLPDHRPPLRRDKPVRISLPAYPPRYIFPATDRSFIFIPRAMRPNQQRLRGKPRSGLGSIGGFSRRTSILGGSYYNGSTYTPSIALSRRSSIAPDIGREYIVSPTGSAISRPPMPLDNARPVVRLPPRPEPQMPSIGGTLEQGTSATGQSTINDLPPPQTHPLPQKPVTQENRPAPIPMHQPKPQKALSVENLDSSTLEQNSQPFQEAFHHQYPMQIQESHTRNPSQFSTGTPLSQIPERAIHAAPFQPTQYAQQDFYPSYPMMQQQPGYYYPPPAPYAAATAPPFVPASQPGQAQGDTPQAAGPGASGSNLVAQEVNGMVYYYDASQLQPMPSYPPYSGPPAYPAPNMSMNGMAPPNPDGFYYPPPGNNMVYYPQ